MLNLFVWPMEFGLPSFDVECLQFMVASKICAAEIEIDSSSTSWCSPTGDLPYVFDYHQNKCYSRLDSFVDYLRTNTQDIVLDDGLISAQFSEYDAYSCLLKQKLFPALVELIWLDKMNFSTVTHPLYNSKLTFPYSIWYIEMKRKQAQNLIKQIKKSNTQLISDAIQVINILSSKLSDNKYFFGDKPSSMDALVFGYLAVLFKYPFPNDRIQLHLVSTPNLVRFVESIIAIYLPFTEEQLQTQINTRHIWAKRKAEAQTKMTESRINRECKNGSQRGKAKKDSSSGYFGYFIAAALTVSALFAIHFDLIQSHSSIKKR